jgi:hypothetical protein
MMLENILDLCVCVCVCVYVCMCVGVIPPPIFNYEGKKLLMCHEFLQSLGAFFVRHTVKTTSSTPM